MYKSPTEKMATSLRPEIAKATGNPCYKSYKEVPQGLYSPSKCKQMKKPVSDNEKPDAYVLNRQWLGYLPLYKRDLT